MHGASIYRCVRWQTGAQIINTASKALGAYPPGRWRAVKAEAAQRWRGTRQP